MHAADQEQTTRSDAGTGKNHCTPPEPKGTVIACRKTRCSVSAATSIPFAEWMA